MAHIAHEITYRGMVYPENEYAGRREKIEEVIERLAPGASDEMREDILGVAIDQQESLIESCLDKVNDARKRISRFKSYLGGGLPRVVRSPILRVVDGGHQK